MNMAGWTRVRMANSDKLCRSTAMSCSSNPPTQRTVNRWLDRGFAALARCRPSVPTGTSARDVRWTAAEAVPRSTVDLVTKFSPGQFDEHRLQSRFADGDVTDDRLGCGRDNLRQAGRADGRGDPI